MSSMLRSDDSSDADSDVEKSAYKAQVMNKTELE